MSLKKEIKTRLADQALRFSYLDIFGFQMALICRIVVPRRQWPNGGNRTSTVWVPLSHSSYSHDWFGPTCWQTYELRWQNGDVFTGNMPLPHHDVTTGETSWTACHPGLCWFWSVRFRCPSGRRVQSSVGETTLSSAPVHHTETLLLCRRRLLSDRAASVVQPLYLPTKERLNRSERRRNTCVIHLSGWNIPGGIEGREETLLSSNVLLILLIALTFNQNV